MQNVYTIIVTYNAMRWAEKCFGCLKASSVPTKIIVIDNGSTDETVNFVKSFIPDVVLIETKENLGFAKANNIGIRYALDNGAEYIFLLNQDAYIEKNTIGKMIQTITSSERVGIVGPIQLTGDGRKMDPMFDYWFHKCHYTNADKEQMREIYNVEGMSAACWMTKADMFREVGGFDTILFKHYGEDNNLCQRARFFGWQLLINTQISICHDREIRAKNANYMENAFGEKSQDIYDKTKYGDINEEFHIRLKTMKEFMKMIVFGCILDRPRCIIHRDKYMLLDSIRKSRIRNVKGGMLYL